MLNWLLSKLPVVGKLLGAVGKTQKFLNGKKSYIAGSILLLQGLSCLVDQFVALQGAGAIVEYLKTIHANECLTKIAEGLGIMGIRAGIAKAALQK